MSARAGRHRRWARHDTAWRDPAATLGLSQEAGLTDPALLRAVARGAWWETLAATGITLLVTREYEHLVIAVGADRTGRWMSFLPIPHPSGLAVDRRRQVVFLASTRNPNQVFDLVPVIDPEAPGRTVAPLVPIRSRTYPGRLYLHDLAVMGGTLYGSASGENAIVRLDTDAGVRRVWWPTSIEGPNGPVFERNHLQLNSIAGGSGPHASFFTASSDRIQHRRPGHRNFPVDGRGVIFSGATREPVVRGLTRPHSVRRHGGRLWVANSGYGELSVVRKDRAEPFVRLPGWTRGLCLHGRVAFVGTSRVIPRFRAYAPGLELDRSVCGVHAVDLDTGRVLGSLLWPEGNQIFAIDWMPPAMSRGFPFDARRRAPQRARALFFGFERKPGGLVPDGPSDQDER